MKVKALFSTVLPDGTRSPGFFYSTYDGSWWRVFADDRPRKFYGHVDNLPLYVRAALGKAGR